MKVITDKVIWITGASSGIGEGLAKALNTPTNKLILSARNTVALDRLKEKSPYPENIFILPLNLEHYDKMESAATIAIHAFGKVDLLINNAGISQRSLLIETDLAVFKKLIDINYLGTVALTKALLPHFVAQKSGHFATVTSLMGRFGSPYRSGYCGAKHALHGFFDVLRMEHEKDNIKVTLICPGFIQTKVAINALTANGTSQNYNDEATKNGLTVAEFSKKMMHAIVTEKHEVAIGKKEVLGIYLKRFFPKLLHKLVLKSNVR